LASVAVGLVVILSFSGCPRTVPPEGLLLAYQSKTGATGIPSIRVMVSIPTAGALWTESTPWTGTAFPDGDVPTGGVGAANDANSIGRLVGWVAGGAKTRMRYGLGSNWEAAIGERAHDFDENALDSAPAIARHSEAAWLVAQKVNQQSKIYLYVPNGQLFQDQDLQGQTFTAFSRNHPVIATSGNRFIAADTLLGGTGTPSVQIVSGNSPRPASLIVSASIPSFAFRRHVRRSCPLSQEKFSTRTVVGYTMSRWTLQCPKMGVAVFF